jgi:hypothetical protein
MIAQYIKRPNYDLLSVKIAPRGILQELRDIASGCGMSVNEFTINALNEYIVRKRDHPDVYTDNLIDFPSTLSSGEGNEKE